MSFILFPSTCFSSRLSFQYHFVISFFSTFSLFPLLFSTSMSFILFLPRVSHLVFRFCIISFFRATPVLSFLFPSAVSCLFLSFPLSFYLFPSLGPTISSFHSYLIIFVILHVLSCCFCVPLSSVFSVILPYFFLIYFCPSVSTLT